MNTTTVTPRVGMSVSYHIGSDSYHEMIIKTEKNARIILTVRADLVLRNAGLTLQEWNELSEKEQESATVKAFDAHIQELLAYEMKWGDTTIEVATRRIHNRCMNKYTKRNDGSYMTANKNFGAITLNSQYSYLALEF